MHSDAEFDEEADVDITHGLRRKIKVKTGSDGAPMAHWARKGLSKLN